MLGPLVLLCHLYYLVKSSVVNVTFPYKHKPAIINLKFCIPAILPGEKSMKDPRPHPLPQLQHLLVRQVKSIAVKTQLYSRVCHFFAPTTPSLLPPTTPGDERSPSLVDLFSPFHFHLRVCLALSLLSQPDTCRCDQLSSCITCEHTESLGCTGPPHL